MSMVVVEVGLLSMGLTTVAKPCGNLIAFLVHERLPGDWSFAVWENVITNIVFGGAMAFALFSSFRILERQQVVICGILVLGTITASVVVRPDIGAMIIGAVSVGHLPTAPDWAPPAARNDLNADTVMPEPSVAFSTLAMTRSMACSCLVIHA